MPTSHRVWRIAGSAPVLWLLVGLGLACTADQPPDTTTGPSEPPETVALVGSPEIATLAPEATTQFTAVGGMSDGSTQPIVVTWTATGGTIDNSGKYSAGATPGTYRVIAEAGTHVADSALITIAGDTDAVASVVLSPASSSVPVGGSMQFSATLANASGNILSGRTVEWSSSAADVATVNGSGKATGWAPGSAQITATSEGHSDAASLTVTTGGATPGPQLPPPLAQSTGASFHVSVSGSDGNPGTESAPWRSIQKAMNSLTPGQQAYVRAGTYETGETFGTDADTYRWTTECSSSAPCSIVAYPGERPVLHGQVRISGAYLRLSGFIIEGPLSADVSSCSGRRANQVDISDSHHLEFSHNVVRFNDYHAGLTAYRVHAVQVIANYFHDNGRFTLSNDPCTGTPTTQVDHGIYWGGTNGGDNLIANNLIEHNRAKGLQLYPNTSDVIVTENTIVANGDYGIKVAGTSSDRNTIVNNIVAFNGKKQIRIEVGNSNVVRRNIAYSPNASLAGVENTTGSRVSDNSTADPLFVNRSGGDYRLGAGSPGVDGGLPEWSMGFGYDGGSRPRGAAPDLGAYER